MSPTIERLLRQPAVALVACILLTFPFWASGLAKLLDFPGGTAEMAQFGLAPAAAYNLATILAQLGGSLLVVFERWTWLGAGALGVFTALTIPIVHRFWAIAVEPFRTIAFPHRHRAPRPDRCLLAIAVLSTRRTPHADRADSAGGSIPARGLPSEAPSMTAAPNDT